MLVNGQTFHFDKEILIVDLLRHLNLNAETVVIELNLNIISKDKYSSTLLCDKDKIEIINFVGGG